jgi:outer membrane protein assembly factor BamB
MAVFFATTRASMTGLLRPDGSLVWFDAPDVSPNALPAFGDVDGDGRIEAVGVGYPDGVRCYDAATGKVKWTLAQFSPGTGAGTASADINSDGRDEVLVTIGTVLYCLGVDDAGTQGKLLWKLDLPATIGPPTIADVTGTGAASILLQGADGDVYCVR